MKTYCKNCQVMQPSSFRPAKDAVTESHYEDLCCDSCHFVVATIQERETLAQPAPAQQPVNQERESLRAAQGEAVMPLIGPLLDAWESCSETMRGEQPEVDKYLRKINRAMEDATPPAAPVQEPVVFYRCNGCGHAYEQVHPTSCDCMKAGGFDRVEYYTTSPAAQHQCKWPTCQSEEYQQALAEQINQELVTGAAQRQWVGLTKYEGAECWYGKNCLEQRPPFDGYAEAIEAAHGIKENT